MTYEVIPHTARMTGMAWFIVVEEGTTSPIETDGTLYYDDYDCALMVAEELTNANNS